MRTTIERPISELVPHASRMSLLDRGLEVDSEFASAEVTLRDDSLFSHGGQIGGWVGIEYMAQTVAVWAGWQARLRGEEPKVGFLLGTRRYECSRPMFKVGEKLHIEAQRQFSTDNGLGQFDCAISIDGEVVATAALTVFEPQGDFAP